MDCSICLRIEEIKLHNNPYFVKELETGFVVLGDSQLFKGYTLFLCKVHVYELHELDPDFKKKFLEEMSMVAEAVFQAFQPVKLNYELLGNSEPHLHWHIFPRYKNDPVFGKPVWSLKKEERYSKNQVPSGEYLLSLKELLINNLP